MELRSASYRNQLYFKQWTTLNQNCWCYFVMFLSHDVIIDKSNYRLFLDAFLNNFSALHFMCSLSVYHNRRDNTDVRERWRRGRDGEWWRCDKNNRSWSSISHVLCSFTRMCTQFCGGVVFSEFCHESGDCPATNASVGNCCCSFGMTNNTQTL